MKICLFADARSVHIRKLVAGLADRGHRVHVVTHKPCDLLGATVERFRVPGPGPTNPRRWIGRRNRYLARFLDAFDVVNVQFLADWGFTPEMAQRGCLVTTAWGSDIVDPPGETAAPPELVSLRVELLRCAAGVTTCGPSFAGVVAAYAGLDRPRVDVVPFGVDVNRFHPSRTECVDRGDAPRVGFFKGFRAVYGASTLVRAMPAIRRRHPRATFEMVGDGDELDICKRLANRLGVSEAVNWIARRPNDRMPSLLDRWTLSVIPSFAEAFGVAALESSAMEVPIVASDVCGLRDTVRHQQTGLFVPPGDANALADAVSALLDDPDRCRRMGATGRATVRREYEIGATHDAWHALYVRVRESTVAMV